MTPNDIAAAAERRRRWLAGDDSVYDDPGHGQYHDNRTLADAYLAEQRERELTFRVNEMVAVERAIRGEDAFGSVWPDWVYEARSAVRHMGENPPPWLSDLHEILGWQGGTVHQALNAVRRLVESEKDRERKVPA